MSEQAESQPGYVQPISVNEMWSLTNREEKNWGIEGYEIHKNYYDSVLEKNTRMRNEKNEKVWAKREHYDKKPVPVDKDGKPIILKRPNYLDEVIKVANSFYNKEKAEKLTEELKDKSLKPLAPKKIEVVKRAPRELFTDTMIKQQKKNIEPQKDKDLTVILEKIKKHEKDREVLPMDTMKLKYGSKDMGRRGSTCCDRVNMTSEAIYVGEQTPFFSTAPMKEGVEDKYEDVSGGLLKDQAASGNAKERKTKKNKALFYPRKFFISAWGKAPAWVYPKVSVKSDKCDLAKVEDAIKEKKEKVTEKLKAAKSRLDIDVPQAWFEVNYHNRLYLKFNLPVPKKPAYDEWKKINPQKHPAPSQYWKRYPVKFVAGKSKPVQPKPEEPQEGKDKQYILDNECNIICNKNFEFRN